MAISFFIVAITGLTIFFFIPRGTKGAGYQEFIGIAKQDWAFIHQWAGILLVILVGIHLILHWKWIVCMTRDIFKKNK
jgi:cytochrome b561